MGLVKNDFVSMDWNDDMWMGKGAQFTAAAQVYQTDKYDKLCVCFHDRSAFMMVTDDMEVLGVDEVFERIKTAEKEDALVKELYEDDFVEIYLDCNSADEDEGDWAEACPSTSVLQDIYGITPEMLEDIRARYNDVSAYWHVIEEDM